VFQPAGAQLGGVTDQQVESFIDGAKSMHTFYLKHIISFVIYIGTVID
jgi:hypothetical protein